MRRIVLGALALGLAGCETLGVRDRSELVLDPQVCVHTTLPVYFAEGEAGLTEPARDMIGSAAETLSHCRIEAVRVIGLASATGSADRNQTLSERRAQTVAAALAGAGLPAPAFDIEAVGQEGAVADGVSEPVRRRVEVIIEAVPAS
jgi:peptidoglycan-associated lipoprotein